MSDRRREARRRAAPRLTAALLSALLALALGEAVLAALDLPPAVSSLRFLGEEVDREDVFRAEPDLFWRLDPATERYAANPLGLRGPWPAAGERGSELRVACVGDSCVFGSGVRYEDGWGPRLGRLLQARLPHRDVQTLLAALPGYSTLQSRELYARHVAPLAPDVTILYVGAWNDFVAAIGADDEERWQELHPRGLERLLLPRMRRLAAGLAAEELESEREAASEAFRDGTYLGGPRVPPDDFRANVAALLAGAREAGSAAVVVLPPHPPSTAATWPVAAEYRALLRAAAEAAGAPVVDGPALFAAAREELVGAEHGPWRPELGDRWPLFSDWVHPTPVGHALLAEAVLEVLLVEGLVPATDTGTAPPRAELVSAEPARLGPGRPVVVDVRGAGFLGPDAPRDAWLGDLWVEGLEIVDDGRLRLELRVPLPAGTRDLELRTPRGPLRLENAVELRPPRLAASVVEGPEPHLALELEASPGAHVLAWVATELRPVPAPTRAGPFALAARPDGRAPGADPSTPFLFEHLELPKIDGTCDSRGRLALELPLDLERLPAGTRTFHLQALVVDAHRLEYAALTEPATVELPR